MGFRLIIIPHKVKQEMLLPIICLIIGYLEHQMFVTKIDSIKVWIHIKEAFNDQTWAEAMNIEIEALQKYNTRDIAD